MASSVNNLPVLGNVNLPVHIMHYSNKEDSKKFFQSGFAFFAVADDQADVEGPNGENLGTLGSCMGGHYQVHTKGEKESVHVIINVEDIWNKVKELLGSDDVQIKFEGMEKIYNEYWPKYQAAQEEKKAKKAKLKEIEQMQKDAEMERALAEEKASRKEPEPEPEPEQMEMPEYDDEGKLMSYGDIEIVDRNDWNLDLEIPDIDWVALDQNIHIPSDMGVGVKTKYDGENFTYKRYPRKKPVVTLEISTWKGTGAVGAIHYYGNLIIDWPGMTQDGTKRTLSISGAHRGIPLFRNSKIELTQVLEAWEIEKYPHNYEYNKPGDRHRGFYAIAGVERRGKEVFEKIFGEGWTLKIDRRF
jgi:hypothetical protein